MYVPWEEAQLTGGAGTPVNESGNSGFKRGCQLMRWRVLFAQALELWRLKTRKVDDSEATHRQVIVLPPFKVPILYATFP
jgi:hypothetical protein